MDIGLILSFLATISIIIFYRHINNILSLSIEKIKKLITKHKNINSNIQNIELHELEVNKKIINQIKKVFKKIKDIISVSFAAQVLIFPVSILLFNKVSLTFLLSNISVSFIIGIIIILGFIVILCPFKILFNILNFLLEVLKSIANTFSKLEPSKIIVVTPKWWQIAIYYIGILGVTYLLLLTKKENKRRIEKKILTYVDNFKCYILSKKKTILIAITIVVILSQIINFIPKDLRIHFIDVGQGDSCLVITPSDKTILIDGGGNKDTEFDVR